MLGDGRAGRARLISELFDPEPALHGQTTESIMVVGICRLSLHFRESGSLKSKRQGLRKLIDRVRAKFNAGIAEVADQDTWQRSTVGLVVVGNESRHVESMLGTIISFIEELYVAEILDRQVELVSYGEGEDLRREGGGWEPEPLVRPPRRPLRRGP